MCVYIKQTVNKNNFFALKLLLTEYFITEVEKVTTESSGLLYL